MNVPVAEYDAYGIAAINAALGTTTVTQDWVNRKYRDNTTIYLQDMFDTASVTTVARKGHIVPEHLKAADKALVLCFLLTNADQKELGFNSSFVGNYLGVMKQFCRNWLPQPRFYKGNVQTVTHYRDSIVEKLVPYEVQKVETVYVDRPYREDYGYDYGYQTPYYHNYCCNHYTGGFVWGWNYCCNGSYSYNYGCGGCHQATKVTVTPASTYYYSYYNYSPTINIIDNSSVHTEDNDVTNNSTQPPVVVVPDYHPGHIDTVYTVTPDPMVTNNAPSDVSGGTVVTNDAGSGVNAGDTTTNNAPSDLGGMKMNPNPTVTQLDQNKVQSLKAVGTEKEKKVVAAKTPVTTWEISSTADEFTSDPRTSNGSYSQSNTTVPAKSIVTDKPVAQANGTPATVQSNTYWVDKQGNKVPLKQHQEEMARNSQNSQYGNRDATASAEVTPNRNYYNSTPKYVSQNTAKQKYETANNYSTRVVKEQPRQAEKPAAFNNNRAPSQASSGMKTKTYERMQTPPMNRTPQAQPRMEYRGNPSGMQMRQQAPAQRMVVNSRGKM
jgi:hypothetical protein